jgi:DNA-binding NarL/FixJ family response regulator
LAFLRAFFNDEPQVLLVAAGIFPGTELAPLFKTNGRDHPLSGKCFPFRDKNVREFRDRDDRRNIMEPIVLLLLEPDPWRRFGFAHVLKDKPQIKILADIDCDRMIALKNIPADVDPTVVMLSHALLIEFKLSLLGKIKERFPRANLLVHGYETNVDKVAEVLIAGAKGYFLLSSEPENLIESLKFVGRGLIWGPPEAIARSLGRLINLKDTKPVATPGDVITPRERTLLNLLAKGLSNKEIANKLGVAEVTVKFHLAKLYKRFNVQSRLQLLTFALDHGLVSGRKSWEARAL